MLENVRSGSVALERKLYRLVIAGLDGDRIDEPSYRGNIIDLAEKGICGFVVRGGARDNLKSFLKSLGRRDLFIGSELLDGTVGRIRGFAEFPSFMALAAASGEDRNQEGLFRTVLTAMASDIVDCGMNMLVVPPIGEPLNSLAPIRAEYLRTLQDAGLFVCEKHHLPEGRATYRPALNGEEAARELVFMGPEAAGYFVDGADVLIETEEPDAAVRELARMVREGAVSEERIDGALAGLQAARSLMAGPREIEPDQDLSEYWSREASQAAVTMVKGKGRFFPLRESDNIPLVYAGDEEYFRTSPLRFYVKQASHISRPLSSKERPVMFLLFGDAAAEELPSGPAADEMESLTRLIRATSPSVVVSFGSPHALTRFKNADVLIAAYDSTSHAQEAVFKCVTGERGFQGRLPVSLDIQDKKGPRR